MLALIRSAGEEIILETSDGDIVIRLDRIRGDKRSAVISVDAPRQVGIFRAEGDLGRR